MRMGSPGRGEFPDAHAALHQAQDFFGAEIIRGLGAHVAARADFGRGRAASRGSARPDRGKCGRVRRPGRVKAGPCAGRAARRWRASRRIFRESPRLPFPGRRIAGRIPRRGAAGDPRPPAGCRRRRRSEVGRLLEPALAHAPGRGVPSRYKEQDADIDPLVADEVGLVAHHVIGAGLRTFRQACLTFQLGNGIAAGIAGRKDQFAHARTAAVQALESRSSASQSSAYHSGGICAASSPRTRLGDPAFQTRRARVRTIPSRQRVRRRGAARTGRAAARPGNPTRRR